MKFVRKVVPQHTYYSPELKFRRFFTSSENTLFGYGVHNGEVLRKIAQPFFMRGILFFRAPLEEEPITFEYAEKQCAQLPENIYKRVEAIEAFIPFDMYDIVQASLFDKETRSDKSRGMYSVCLLSKKRGHNGINLLRLSPYPTLYPETKNYIPNTFPIYGITEQEWMNIRSWYYFN